MKTQTVIFKTYPISATMITAPQVKCPGSLPADLVNLDLLSIVVPQAQAQDTVQLQVI